MDTRAEMILENAVTDGQAAIVTVVLDDSPHSLRGRFCHRDRHGFTFEAPVWPEGLSSAKGTPAVFEFGIVEGAVRFDARVRKVEMKDGTVHFICFDPEAINVTRRREHFRVTVPGSAGVSLTLWKIPTHWVLRDRPKPSMQIKGELIDLSGGGMGLKVVPPATEAINDAQRLRVELRYGGEEAAVIDAQIIYRSDPSEDGSIRIGIAFRKLDTADGRRGATLLSRAIAALQRKTIRETVNATI
jgi:c-di-GMP-binding flagellar brake protein YcgR